MRLPPGHMPSHPALCWDISPAAQGSSRVRGIAPGQRPCIPCPAPPLPTMTGASIHSNSKGPSPRCRSGRWQSSACPRAGASSRAPAKGRCPNQDASECSGVPRPPTMMRIAFRLSSAFISFRFSVPCLRYHLGLPSPRWKADPNSAPERTPWRSEQGHQRHGLWRSPTSKAELAEAAGPIELT